MLVTTHSLEGVPGPKGELTKQGVMLWLDNEQVVAISFWGRFVALTLPRRLVLIDQDEYRQFERGTSRHANE